MSADVLVTTETRLEQAAELADVAAATFPLACPPGTTDDDTAAFIAEHLTEAHFVGFLESEVHDVIVARVDDAIVGYSLIVHTDPTDPEVRAVVTERPVTELSKMYVLARAHGSGASHALMAAAVTGATDRGSVTIWLGVSNVNHRAQAFYRRSGFTIVGRKSFWLNGDEQRDYVLTRPLR